MGYTVIASKETTTGLNWVIDAKAPLSAEDKEFIKVFAPGVMVPAGFDSRQRPLIPAEKLV